MTFAALPTASPRSASRAASAASPRLARGVLALTVLTAAIAGYLATDGTMASAAAARAGEDLTRLLRAMAAIKAAMAVAVLAGVWWRMATPTPSVWLAAYVVTGAAMGAGPGMIWTMTNLASGALLLHAGLIGGLVVLWRDPEVGRRIEALVARRRALRSARS